MNIIKAFVIVILTLTGWCAAAQVGINYGDASGNSGDIVSVDVTTSNFTDMITFQFSTNFNPAVVEVQSVSNLNATLGLTQEEIGLPSEIGDNFAITCLWTDPFFNGVTLPDGDILFTINFRLIGSGGDETMVEISNLPRVIDFNDLNGQVNTTSDPGLVEITGGTGGGDLELIGSMESGDNGDEVCVQISVNGFENILSAAWNHTYNTSVLDFVEIRNINLPGLNPSLFNVNESTGEIIMSYTNPTFVTVGDGTVIYELCFQVVGTAGQMSQVDFVALPGNPIEIIQRQGNDNVPLTPEITDGKVNVTGQFAGLNISIPDDLVVEPGAEICVPLLFENVNDIQGIQDLDITWNTSELTYVRSQNVMAPGPGFTENASNVSSGEYSFLYFFVGSQGEGWTQATPPPFSFLELCFTVNGECDDEISLSIASDALIVNSLGNEIPYVGNGGLLTVNCAMCDIPAPAITNVSCNGKEDGMISLDLSECDNVNDVEWSGDPQVSGLNGENAVNLAPGTYSVTVTWDNDNEEIFTDLVVSEPDRIELTEVEITVSCSGMDGAIDITANGGSGVGYSYAWSNDDDTEDISGLAPGDYIVTVSDMGAVECQVVFGPFTLAGGPTVTGVASMLACFGDQNGTIDISVDGGTGPFSYDWSCDGDVDANGDISNLPAGACVVTVTDDNGCQDVEAFNLTEPSELVITDAVVTHDLLSNGNGSIVVTAEGGTGDFIFMWDPDVSNGAEANGLGCGTYELTIVDDNGCEVSDSYNVEGLELVGEVSDVDCFGENNGAVDISLVGECGSGDYFFDWSCDGDVESDGDITNLPAGECCVTVTDNVTNVQAEACFTVGGPVSALDIGLVQGVCPDPVSAEVFITGGTAPYIVNWSNGQSGTRIDSLSEGPYSAFVTDANGCEAMVQGEFGGCFDGECYEALEVITPNGDGKNEEFVINCVQKEENLLRIFTRYGQEVYQVKNYQNDWIGLDDNGDEVEEDTYQWVLEVFLSSGTQIETGTITVLRKLR